MKTAADLIALLFLSREVAHREHLKTNSHAHYVVPNDFYDAVVDLIDEFAETYQGIYGVIPSIPFREFKESGSPADMLEVYLEWVENNRGAFNKTCDKPLQNILDEVCGLFNRTLYKLRNLK